MKILLFTFLIATLISCSEQQDTQKGVMDDPEVKNAKNLVDSLHHESMKRIEPVLVLRMKLEEQLNSDSLSEADKSMLKTKSAHLRSLNKKMSSWMKNFKHDTLFESKTKAIDYFKKEFVKIKSIDEEIAEALQ